MFRVPASQVRDYREVEHRAGAKPPAGRLREPHPPDPGALRHLRGAKPPGSAVLSRAVTLERLISERHRLLKV